MLTIYIYKPKCMHLHDSAGNQRAQSTTVVFYAHCREHITCVKFKVLKLISIILFTVAVPKH